ncbi:hypothetical protein [Nonomuraea basaltis]|uniref:hypothetical protein n=1 Tax=Nonomuraea basaltis TaxID=2495887 RepID=UPI00110C483A|nr:hypothetical protein [Nonomuraea basaltis]TMR90620.1 hypothetical protein EJK15_54290 [Nonomuraea basaltis]
MFLCDSAMTGAILGLFTLVWFGWAQEQPPATWKARLALGSVLGAVLAISGGVLAWRNWGSGSVLADDGLLRTYLIIVGIEFAVTAAGIVALRFTRKTDYQAPWTCLVVGVHFYPMAPVFRDIGLYALATVLTAVAAASIPIARRRHLTISAVTGAAAGTTLLLFAAYSLITLTLD